MKKSLFYYIDVFTLEGHETWRAHLSGRPDGLEVEIENQKKNGQTYPKITKRKSYKLDRITGDLSVKDIV